MGDQYTGLVANVRTFHSTFHTDILKVCFTESYLVTAPMIQLDPARSCV